MTDGSSTTPPAPKTSTQYVILEDVGDGKYSIVKSKLEAIGAEQAVRSYLKAFSPNGNVEGMFLAIPQRSWKPMKVEVQQTTTLKIS